MKPLNNLASIKRRFCAFLVDFLIIHGSSYLFLAIFKLERDLQSLLLAAFLFSFLYFVVFWSVSKGKSIGALIFKIKISSEDSSHLKWRQIIWRAFDKSIFIAPGSLLIIWAVINIYLSVRLLKNESFNKRKQVLWDIHSKTVVLRDD